MSSKIKSIGGQALIEGVMFMSPDTSKDNLAYACRQPDGKIITESSRYVPFLARHKYLKIPFVRGVLNMVEMMVVGFKALNFSSRVAMAGEEEDFEWYHMAFSIIAAMIFAIVFFKLLPLLIAQAIDFGLQSGSGLVFNLIEGIVKLAIFVSYIYIISLLPDVKRVFQYHGAEHKTINCYEAGKSLTVSNIKSFPTYNARCGTSFLVLVILISVLVYALVPMEYTFWVKFGYRLLLLPVIAGIAYELMKISAKYCDNIFMKIIAKPGFYVQKLTTKEPDDKQIEVAIKSLKQVL